MHRQATGGDVDFITGDYLAGTRRYPILDLPNPRSNEAFAEVNIASNAEAYARGEHPGYEETAWMGFQESIDAINQKHIKVAINGGALYPEGLARKVDELVSIAQAQE